MWASALFLAWMFWLLCHSLFFTIFFDPPLPGVSLTCQNNPFDVCCYILSTFFIFHHDFIDSLLIQFLAHNLAQTSPGLLLFFSTNSQYYTKPQTSAFFVFCVVRHFSKVPFLAIMSVFSTETDIFFGSSNLTAYHFRTSGSSET